VKTTDGAPDFRRRLNSSDSLAPVSERFEQFRAHVLNRPALLDQLRAEDDRDKFTALCVAVARQCGFELSPEEVVHAIRVALAEWRERPIP
jgi:hypothetical protein